MKKPQRPKITKEIKELADKIITQKWDSKNESAQDYVNRMATMKRNQRKP